MLQNAYFLAKIGADTAEIEQHFAEILPISRRVADHAATGSAPTPSPSTRPSSRGLARREADRLAAGQLVSRVF